MFNDNVVFDATNTPLSTGDLQAVNVDSPTMCPKMIAEQARLLFFSSHHKTGVVCATDHAPETPGLYVARVF